MEVYETEEQQVEAVKKWFKENGISLVMGLVIGLSGITGWKFYQEEQHSHNVQASDLYMSLVNQMESSKGEADLSAEVDFLAAKYSDTPYAALATLMLAKNDYEKGEIQAAISKLSWASKNASDIETQQVAQTRLIRVHLSESMFDEAEVLLNMPHPESFDASYEELRGDLLVAKNELAGARVAYDKAIASTDGSVNRWLQTKREQLGD